MNLPRPLFQTNITIFTINYVKNVHQVYGAEIRTHNLYNTDFLPQPLDQGCDPKLNKLICCSFSISKPPASKQVKQEVSCTLILPVAKLVFTDLILDVGVTSFLKLCAVNFFYGNFYQFSPSLIVFVWCPIFLGSACVFLLIGSLSKPTQKELVVFWLNLSCLKLKRFWHSWQTGRLQHQRTNDWTSTWLLKQ